MNDELETIADQQHQELTHPRRVGSNPEVVGSIPTQAEIFSLSLGELVANAVDQRWFLIHHLSHLQ